MPASSSKHPPDKTESIYYSYECIPICNLELWSSRKQPLDKTEFIVTTDAYPSQKSMSILQVFEILSQSTLFKY